MLIKIRDLIEQGYTAKKNSHIDLEIEGIEYEEWKQTCITYLEQNYPNSSATERFKDSCRHNFEHYFVAAIGILKSLEKITPVNNDMDINKSKSGVTNNITIYRDISNSQIQQETSNSNQTINIKSKFDYDGTLKVLHEIQKATNYEDFEREFSGKAQEVKSLVDNIIKMLDEKDKPAKIKTALHTLRDLSIGITSSLIASGITVLVSQLLM